MSSNWSGYVLSGARFTSVSGSFTVPALGITAPAMSAGAPTSSTFCEWVGIDGYASDPSTSPPESGRTGARTLLQAGIDEVPNGGAKRYIKAWWERYPAGQIPFGGVEAQPGDTVSVSLRQVHRGLWSVSLADLTTKQAGNVTVGYGGAARSAQWIVEADDPAGAGPAPPSLAPFEPAVVFSDASFSSSAGPTSAGPTSAGTVLSATRLTMVQDGSTVSEPSLASAGRFTVTYEAPATRTPAGAGAPH